MPWFDLHGIFYTHYGSNPQDILPYINKNIPTPVELKPVYNAYDEYAIAVFANNSYIGWVPKELSKTYHSFLTNGVNYNAKIVRTYSFNDGSGTGATIYIYFTQDCSDFNPVEVSVNKTANISLTNQEIAFMGYLNNKTINSFKSANYWINDYEIIPKLTVQKLVKYDFLCIIKHSKSYSALYYFFTDKGLNLYFAYLDTLKKEELRKILKKYKLSCNGTKAEMKNIIKNYIITIKTNSVVYNLKIDNTNTTEIPIDKPDNNNSIENISNNIKEPIKGPIFKDVPDNDCQDDYNDSDTIIDSVFKGFIPNSDSFFNALKIIGIIFIILVLIYLQ